ncbi:JAB domain-containing protein [Pedobacter nyackensis]|uniref:JAB domain-containing protein n=1 Tax=Pedobacter nyackensis TaxID=475255 RepID=UPI00292F5939|nr:JAB domain-containing protein [Pedobacter nyackensis]
MVNKTLFKVAEVELTYKPNYKPSERPQISTSKQAHEVFISHWSLGKIELIEEFKILLLNRRNRVLGIVDISMGGITETLADPKVIFAVALKSGATGIILCHNHPSEELQPGKSDIELTKRLQQCGRLLDIDILDHLIVSKDTFYSFADEGLM